MSQLTFDPYLKWLGIPATEARPIHFYRLLGITLFETDPDVIAISADKQIEHIRKFSGSAQGELAERIINELTKAKLTLLNPTRKANYDQQLTQYLQKNHQQQPAQQIPVFSTPVLETVPPAFSIQTQTPATTSAVRSGTSSQVATTNYLPWVALGGSLVVLAGLIGLLIIQNQSPTPIVAEVQPTQSKSDSDPIAKAKPTTPKKSTTTNPVFESALTEPTAIEPAVVEPTPTGKTKTPQTPPNTKSPPSTSKSKPATSSKSPSTKSVTAEPGNGKTTPAKRPMDVTPEPEIDPGMKSSAPITKSNPTTMPSNPVEPNPNDTPFRPGPPLNSFGLPPDNNNVPGLMPPPMPDYAKQKAELATNEELSKLLAEIDRTKAASEIRLKQSRETYLKAFDIESNKIRSATGVETDLKSQLIKVLNEDKERFETKKLYSIAPVMLPHNKVLLTNLLEQEKIGKAYNLIADRLLKDRKDALLIELKKLKDIDPDLKPQMVFAMTIMQSNNSSSKRIECYSNNLVNGDEFMKWTIDGQKRLALSLRRDFMYNSNLTGQPAENNDQYLFEISPDGRSLRGIYTSQYYSSPRNATGTIEP